MFIRGWNKERIHKFQSSLANIGAQIANWVEAIQYSGKPRELHFELSAKRCLFSRHHLAAGIDKESLSTMSNYIGHHPDYRAWKVHVTNCELVARSGDYMIVERRGLKGGNRDEVAKIVRRFGGSQDDISYFLDKTEDEILGYVLPNAYLSAADLAEVVQVGQTTQITPEEQQELVRGIARWAETLHSKSREDILLERVILRQSEQGLSETRIRELLEECGNAEQICEPLMNKLDDSVIDEAFNDIDSRNELTADDKAVTSFALITLLYGTKPTDQGLSCLERICGKEFVNAIMDKAS